MSRQLQQYVSVTSIVQKVAKTLEISSCVAKIVEDELKKKSTANPQKIVQVEFGFNPSV